MALYWKEIDWRREVTTLHCYLIRQAAALGVLGIFWAETSERLWWLVDQANADPSLYEYAELADGFLAFTGQVEPVAEQLDTSGNWETPRFDWTEALASETLLAALHQQSLVEWKPIPPAGEAGSGLRPPPRDKSDPGTAAGG